MKQKEFFICVAGAVAGVILACYADTCHAEPVILKRLLVIQQEALTRMEMEQLVEKEIKTVSFAEETMIFSVEVEPIFPTEEWHGTDRKLTDWEWNALSQMILAEARGEFFDVQYNWVQVGGMWFSRQGD